MSRRRPLGALGVLGAALLAGAAVAVLLAGPVPDRSVPVAVIGDSLTEKVVPLLPEAFEGTPYYPDFLFGKSGYSARNLASDGEGLDVFPPLPDTVIVALGTVDMRMDDPGTQRRSIEGVLDKLGPSRRVIWVNAYRDDSAPEPEVSGPGEQPISQEPGLDVAFNELLREAQGRHPNLEIANWRDLVLSGSVSVTSDGIHYFPDGYLARAAFYRDALSQQASG